jgi:two-component system chemotaxis sensor kinase CheA
VVAPDPYRYFRVEAQELHEQLVRGVLQLERAPQADTVARLLRLTHTLKGAARVVKQHAIADGAHEMEDALAPLRGSDAAVPRSVVERLLLLLDRVAGGMAALNQAAPPNQPPNQPPRQAPHRPPERANGPAAGLVTDVVDPAGRPDGRRWSADRTATVPAEVADIDSLLGQVGEVAARLAAVRHAIDTPAETGDDWDAVRRAVDDRADEAERALRDVRANAERLRLAPTGGIIAALHRVVRDTADAQRKDVTFIGRGGRIRLDAHVLAVVTPALVQLVRNAVAHGVETPQDRAAAGKPRTATVAVEITRRHHRVVFACSDDGRGFDLDAVRRAAERKGATAAEIERLDERELIDLLLAGGISTAAAVTDAAGRGIGLDVVREVAQRLGGDVGVRTDSGRGTTVELVVPVSQSAVESLMVEGGGTVAAVPLDRVLGCRRLAPAEISYGPRGDSAMFDGKPIPLVSMGRLLSPRSAFERTVRPTSSVVLSTDSGEMHLCVDRLIGTARLVLTPLPPLAPAAPFVSGVWSDTNRVLRLALDPDGLRAAAGSPVQHGGGPRPAARAPLLVIDDSLTTRMLEQSILESAGYEVDLATCAEEGLDKAHERQYGLFLVDIEMPGMDGFTFIERTRADPDLSHTPAILVSSRSSAADIARGKAVGASGYVAKSEFDQRDLLARIRTLVGA